MLLTKKQFDKTVGKKMIDVTESAQNFNPNEFDKYVNNNLIDELGLMKIAYIWETDNRKWRHVVFNTEIKNKNYIVIINLKRKKILGHYILDMNELYGLNNK